MAGESVSVPDAVERLLYALESYSDARAALRECQEQAGYEAGYFCSRYSDAASEAQQRCADAFLAAVSAALATGGNR